MKVLVAGDYCPQYRVAELFEIGDFESVLGDITKYTELADYSIANLECPVTYGGERPIIKHGPNLCCTSKGIDALQWAGFNSVTLANNHFYDFGDKGVINTIKACEDRNLDTVGGGNNIKESSTVLYKQIQNKTLAVINCCEHEFSIATETSGGSNPLNPIQQCYAIQAARKKADYVLVIVHGGHEMFQLPNLRMQETYRFFIDNGADAVVNHHQHCFSGFETYKEKPIFYGLGNFCFDEKGNTGGIWNEGFFVILSFSDTICFDIYPYIQCDKNPKVELLQLDSFDKKLEELNKIIQDKCLLQENIIKYYQSCYKQSSFIFEPLMNRLYNSLRYRGLLPSFVSNNRKILASNFIGCESHRDKLLYYLNSYKGVMEAGFSNREDRETGLGCQGIDMFY